MAYRTQYRPRAPVTSWWRSRLETWRWLWRVRWRSPLWGHIVATITGYAVAAALATPGLLMSGCDSAALQVEAQVASGIATGANAALPILIDRYRQEGNDVILAVKARGGTEAEARDAIAGVKERWARVWEAWDMLAKAQNDWAKALEAVGAGQESAAALGALKSAYCGLLFVWPKDVPAIPLAPIQCGETP